MEKLNTGVMESLISRESITSVTPYAQRLVIEALDSEIKLENMGFGDSSEYYFELNKNLNEINWLLSMPDCPDMWRIISNYKSELQERRDASKGELNRLDRQKCNYIG